MNTALLIFGLIILSAVIRGLQKGALKMLFGLVSWIFVLIFVLVATPGIDQLLTEYTPLDNVIQEQVTRQTQAYWEKQEARATNQVVSDLKKKIGDQGFPLAELGKSISADTQIPLNLLQTYLDQHAEQIYAKLPALLREAYEKGQLRVQVAADQTTGNIRDAVDQVGQSLADQAAVAITGWIMRAISLLLALVIARIVTAVVAAVIDTASHAPVIGGLSRALGGLMGLGIGLIDSWFLMYLVEILSWTSLGAYWAEQIGASAILKLISGYNPLSLLFR